MSELDAIARFYDLDYGDIVEDVMLYEQLAQRCGSPVLEVGVGTGRIAIPLARAGFQVTGVDCSQAMIDLARAKAAGLETLRLVVADARTMELGEKYRLAFFALSTLRHITEPADQRAVLRRVGAHLADGGLLVLDVDSPDLGRLAEEDKLTLHAWTKREAATGRYVTKLESYALDAARQLQEVTFLYDEVEEGGALRRTVVQFPLCYFMRHELEMLLEQSGFRVEALYGDYALSLFESESPRMIFLARRAA